MLINEVAHGGERIVLESHGRPKAAIVSLADLQRLDEKSPAEAPTVEREMMAWLETTERLMTRPHDGDASTAALLDAREDRVAEDPGLYRRERGPQAGRRRKR